MSCKSVGSGTTCLCGTSTVSTPTIGCVAAFPRGSVTDAADCSAACKSRNYPYSKMFTSTR